MQNSVSLLGFQRNPYYYMAQADLFVCSSIAEGFSTVAAEAVILNLPVVTTDCSGMRELLGNSKYGIITENSIDGLFAGIKHILDEPKEQEYYKNQSGIRGKEFSIRSAVDEIQKLFG